MSDVAGPAPGNDERVFFRVVVILALVFGAGFCLVILAVNGAGKSSILPPDHPRQLVDFALTNQSGRTVTRSELAGKILVVDFLLTSCSRTCQEVNRHMAEIQQRTSGQPDVRLVSLTVDPRSDTVTVLAKYGERFGADTNRWLLLTGDKGMLYHLIGTSFLAPGAEEDPLNYMPGNFSHAERIAIVDQSGSVRGYFDGMKEDATDAVVAEIARLRK